jgi:nucleoside-diphosphate-sugar epimerase
MSGRRIVVTGANGFVGRHVCRAAVDAGWDVTGTVRNEAENVSRAGARPVRAALEPGALAPHFAAVDVVVHLANIGAERAGASYEEVNVAGTRAVVEAARAAGVPRVVYFSGLGVASYGKRRSTTNRYFASKLRAEAELFASALEVCVFRPSYVVGAGGELLEGIAREAERGVVEVIADGAHRMQPVAVSDAAEAVLAAAERNANWPLVFDLVGPEPVSYRSLVDRVARFAGATEFRVAEIAAADARRAATGAGGYRGMGPEELDCLLCDEVGGPGALQALLGRDLVPLDVALEHALRPRTRLPGPD